MADQLKTMDFETSRVTVPVGASLAVLVDQIQRQHFLRMRVISGATVQLIGVTYGITLGITALVNSVAGGASANAYQLLQSDALPFDIQGPARFYLADAGATVVVGVIKGRNGYPYP